MNHTSENISVDGVRVHLQRKGRGEPILFLHGAGGVTRWLPFFDSLASDHDLLVPDHPGFGKSDDPEWIRSMSDLAMFYLEFIEQLELRNVHLVGHSIGGWLAAEIAVRDRTPLKSLTLIAPAGIRIPGIPMGEVFLWSREEHARNLFFDQAISEQMLAEAPSDEELDAQVKNRYTFAKLAWQPRLFHPDLEKWLRRARVPAHILWGADDRVLPVAYAGLWEQRLPQVRLTVIERCGHLPQVEQADYASREIRQFLREVSA